jgi:hypothetical protein
VGGVWLGSCGWLLRVSWLLRYALAFTNQPKLQLQDGEGRELESSLGGGQRFEGAGP